MTTLKRMDALERGKNAVRTLGAWPVILGWDEWEALAMVIKKSCALTREEMHLWPLLTTCLTLRTCQIAISREA